MYLWNGTQFNDVTGQQVDNTLYITSLNQLNEIRTPGVYNIIYTENYNGEIEKTAYTMYVTEYLVGAQQAQGIRQIVVSSEGTSNRLGVNVGEFVWFDWETTYNVHTIESNTTSGHVAIFHSGSYANRHNYIKDSGVDISSLATQADLATKANLSDLSAKADKPILTSPVVSGNNITLSIGKIYDLTSLGSLTNSNVIYLSDLGVITGECPTWHFFFTCGASMPGFGNDIDPIWGEYPDWSDDDLIEVDVVRVGNVYHGLWSKKDLSE